MTDRKDFKVMIIQELGEYMFVVLLLKMAISLSPHVWTNSLHDISVAGKSNRSPSCLHRVGKAPSGRQPRHMKCVTTIGDIADIDHVDRTEPLRANCCYLTSLSSSVTSLRLVHRTFSNHDTHQDRTLAGNKSRQPAPHHQLYPQCMPLPRQPRPQPPHPEPVCRSCAVTGHASRSEPAERVCLRDGCVVDPLWPGLHKRGWHGL